LGQKGGIMALPPVNKQKQGDIKALIDNRLKTRSGDKVPRVEPGPGRPEGAKDSYQRSRSNYGGTVAAPTGPEEGDFKIPPEEDAALEKYISSKAGLAELEAMAKEPGASPVIQQMAEVAAMIVAQNKEVARQITPWFDENMNGIPDNLE
jgi:hypothetical protein